ncbi:MAG: NERD domain-containing protein [Acidimicrobiales bacterium]|nr:NERD domain-containing protein [Acidimicrobiales bacterium]
MGLIVPEDFPLESLANEAERRVVTAFRDRLNDGWLILPDVGFQGTKQEHQLDVVLIHSGIGIIDIEVKSHRMSIIEGRWCDNRKKEVIRQPPVQAKDNAYGLRALLRAEFPSLPHLQVPYGIALPNTAQIKGALGPELQPCQVLLSGDLDEPGDKIDEIACLRADSQVLTDADVEAIVSFLRPDAEFVFDHLARQRHARSRLNDLCATQVRTLETLDANRRVIVNGAAGTGKTRLGLAWARRAFARDERVLLTCFNDPLAGHLRDLAVDDEDFVVGPFLRLAFDLEGMPPIDIPNDADNNWWNTVGIGHLQADWHLVTSRFDTIVVDEAQDFSPAWLALLATLLDPEGPRRMYLLADRAQMLYSRGFVAPAAEDGWVQAELTVNCRNAKEIGRLLRRRLGGAASPSEAPDAIGLEYVSVDEGDQDRIVEVVRDLIDRLVLDERDPGTVMVLTFSTALRDRLTADLGLTGWEDRANGIVVQTVHRAKGLESDTVLLVTDHGEVREDLLYVGVSRAVSELLIIAPEGVGTRLGLINSHHSA